MKKKIITTLLLMLVFAVHRSFAGEAPGRSDDFKVTLPDGLYLYQPKLNRDPFSPLFIVENGKLIDPYALRDRIGMEMFDKEYVKGKEFNVYSQGGRIGTLSDIILLLNDPRHEEEYSSDMIGYGKYEGEALPGKADGAFYAGSDFFIEFGALKAVAAPRAHVSPLKNGRFGASAEDAQRATDAVRKKYEPYARGIIAKELAKEKRKILYESRSNFDSVAAVDLDGNGKKELIGIYSFSYEYKARSTDPVNGILPLDILFVQWDSGEVEKVLEGMSQPAFSLGGVIDLDGDGIYEIIVQERAGPEIAYDESGKRIVVLRHYRSGWKKVFSTIPVNN